jgi:cardiolipin synthase
MHTGPTEPDESFPWRDRNRFRLLIDGSMFFPAMLQAIKTAQSHVLIEMYIMESGRIADQFIEALLQAVTKGVSIQVLLDDYGSGGFLPRDRKRLTDSGVQLVYYNPLRFELFRFKNNLFRTHRKFMLVDGETVYVGGAGISDSFVGKEAWHDCMLEISGPVAADWQTLFRRNLERWSTHVEIPRAKTSVNTGGASGRLVHTSGGVRLPLKKILLNRIRRGERQIWLASAYFIPSGKIRRALRRAAIGGKGVRLLLPGPVTDHPAVRYASRRYYSRLLRHGVRIFEYQNRFQHSKVVLVDDWCTIGSSNLDRWNFRWNLEANQEVEDAALAAEVKNMLLDDFGNSEEINYTLWLQRSRLQRLKEWLWGKIDGWLTGWGQDK